MSGADSHASTKYLCQDTDPSHIEESTNVVSHYLITARTKTTCTTDDLARQPMDDVSIAPNDRAFIDLM
jgi:hypothetical protein